MEMRDCSNDKIDVLYFCIDQIFGASIQSKQFQLIFLIQQKTFAFPDIEKIAFAFPVNNQLDLIER